MSRVIVIGIGGIGSYLLPPLLKYLNYTAKNKPKTIMLVDGDFYESKNASRQIVPIMDENKALASEITYAKEYSNITLTSYPMYVTKENISDILEENDTIFLCVDNNYTRMLIDDYLYKNIKSYTLISAGNELYTGNVQLVQKTNNDILTPTLINKHPEVSDGKDKSPNDMSCEELAEAEPQISIVNQLGSSLMLNLYMSLVENPTMPTFINEIYFNTESGSIRVEKQTTKILIPEVKK